jgi:teichuronic acid biosynthesis protein TuaE
MVNELLFPRQKRLERLFYLMIAFALLGPTLGVPVTEGFNLTFFRIVFVLLVGGIIMRLAMQKSLETYYMYPVRWYAAFFLFWFVYGLISLTWAVSLGDGIRYLFFLGMMMPLALSFPFFIHSEPNFWKTQRVLFWVFAVIIYFAVIESITLIHLPSSRAFGTDQATVTSVFTNQNDLATCITLGLPFLATALFMLDLSRKHKILVYCTGVLALYALLATGSRSNTFFALPLAALVLIFLIPQVIDRKKLTGKNIAKGIAAVLAALLIANTLSAAFLSEEARQQARTKLASTLGFLLDINRGSWSVEDGDKDVVSGETGQSATVRKYLILNGLKFLQKSHYMGVGPGNIEPLMKNAPKVNKVNMHNWWAEVLVNFGVIIFVLYMSLYFWMLWRLFKLARLKNSSGISPVIRWGAASCLAALTGYFFGGMAPSTAIHFTPMWICYGIGLAVIALGENQKKNMLNTTTGEKEVA